jgi:predicted amidohydrolase YtcJ
VKATIDALKPVVQTCLAKEPGDADDWFEAVQLDNCGFSAAAKDLNSIEAKKLIALWGTVWVNNRGLALLGVSAATPDPPGGKIARDASGTPQAPSLTAPRIRETRRSGRAGEAGDWWDGARGAYTSGSSATDAGP